MIYLILFWTFFKIGLFTFGGGYAMLPLIISAVEQHGWMDMEVLIDFVAIAESTPGPLAINMSTFVGMQQAGILGAVCATLGTVLPSFIVILIVAKIFLAFKNSKVVRGVMYGIRPATVGLILASVVTVAKTVFFPDGVKTLTLAAPRLAVSFAIFILAMVLVMKKKHPILIVGISAGLGILAGFILHL